MTLWLGCVFFTFLCFAPNKVFFQLIHYAKKSRVFFKRRPSSSENGKKLYFLLSSSSFFEERRPLPVYKDFTSYVELLRAKQLETGVSLKDAFSKLQGYLKKDLAMTQTLEREQREATFQSLIMVSVTWIFVLIDSLYFVTKNNYFLMSLCALYQVLGLFFQYRLVFVLQKKKSSAIEKTTQKMASLMCLSKSGLSLNLILKECQLNELNIYRKGELKVFLDQLESLMSRWKSQGHPIEKALDSLIDDLSFFYEQRMQSFIMGIKVLNTFFVAFFVLPVFFLLSLYPLL